MKLKTIAALSTGLAVSLIGASPVMADTSDDNGATMVEVPETVATTQTDAASADSKSDMAGKCGGTGSCGNTSPEEEVTAPLPDTAAETPATDEASGDSTCEKGDCGACGKGAAEGTCG